MTDEAAGTPSRRNRFCALAQELSKTPRHGVAVVDAGDLKLRPDSDDVYPYMVLGVTSDDPLAVVRIDS